MGNGITDTPALHAANVGISVDTAVNVAKEAADIISAEVVKQWFYRRLINQAYK